MLAPMLKHLDFASRNGRLVSGLVPLKDGEASITRVDERLAIRDAIAIGKIDYVFFRRFSDDRSSSVVAYVIDNVDNHLTEKALADIHKKVWLYGGVPLIYVAWPSRIDILTCARGPDFWHDGKYEYTPADHIEQAILEANTISQALESRYSAWRLADGTFWDDPRNASLANNSERAHERLIAAVVETDEALKGEVNPLLRRLLLLTVLVKYLEDRDVFPKNWFAGFCKGARSFFDALRLGTPDEIVRLLANLERRFNGDIFVLTKAASSNLTKTVLKEFAKLVEAKTINHQRYLWEQFSFAHIPVEIVSHLYQRFVKGGHGTVYTPPFLAALLLDHAMPYDKLTGDEKILDPACGSGVFLVGAFRRLVNVFRAKNGWKSLDVDILKDILRRSIFGIELDAGAVDLATFSLALAVCDALKPEVIWEKLKFDQLRGRNLFESDFFEEVRKADEGTCGILDGEFDVVLGNPPFESNLTPHGITLNREAAKIRGDLPDKQAAYLFLEQGIKQLKRGGRLCLIQPSGILHNRNAFAFRQRIFKEATVEIVMDFTSIRSLYEDADTKTAALLVISELPAEKHNVSHLTFRRTFGTLERIAFEIDHYDWHWVPQEEAAEDPYIWRVNLMGGGRLASLSRRFRSLSTLKTFIDKKGLKYGEGFTVGNGSHTNSFLTGMTYLPSQALEEDGIVRSKLERLTQTGFERERDKELYDAPMIVIRKNERLQMDYWDKGRLAFAIRVVGIGVGRSSKAILKQVYKRLKGRHDTYRLSCVLHGTEAFVAKATAIRKQDIDSLPFPEDESELALSYWEKAIEEDSLRYFCDFVRLGQNSVLLQQSATEKTLQGYRTLFCKLLRSVYQNLQAGAPVFLDGLICQPFYFGERPTDDVVARGQGKALHSLIYHKHHESLRTVRLLRFYVDNVMLIVKPERLRFWIPSTAIRDADETIVSLREQGY
jgi:hypothetical protein